MTQLTVTYIRTEVSIYDHYNPHRVNLRVYVQVDTPDGLIDKRLDGLSPAQYLRFQQLQNRLANQELL